MGQDDGAHTITAQYSKMHSSAHSIINEEGSERGSAASSLPIQIVFSNMKHSRGEFNKRPPKIEFRAEHSIA